jgi:hypothetical protein
MVDFGYVAVQILRNMISPSMAINPMVMPGDATQERAYLEAMKNTGPRIS